MFNRIKCKDHESWLAERQKGIGGSDAATILGLNPYKTNQELYREKIGLIIPEDISAKPYVKYGINAEGSLRQLFRLDYPDYKVYSRNNEILRNKELPYLQASVDGELTDPEGRKGILEVKTTTILRSMQKEQWRDRVPDNYYCQILHYLLVTGYEFAILKAQMKYEYPEKMKLITNHYHFEKSDLIDDLKTLLRAEVKFWDHIINEQEPDLLLPAI